tara:strand:- start:6367 stop:6609 length:243 start_codon:yes stop_codon:yes gene_type:complete
VIVFFFKKTSKSLFVITSNPDDLNGTNRKYDIDYNYTLISVNAEIGIINWGFQETKHNLWDFDLLEYPIICILIKKKEEW